MRRNIVHPNARSLTYAIREIVEVAYRFQRLGLEITWENIGDPIEKGEKVAPWIREIVEDIVARDESWGYCNTAGVPATREFLAAEVNRRDGVQITADDVVFFNGIGDAVGKVYGFLRREARILGPNPAYSTHSSAESAHSGYRHFSYELDPHNGWMPDVEDIRRKVHYNDTIGGILLVNPDNPTGAVYPREILEEIVEVARQNDLFIICDEIYSKIVYEAGRTLPLSQVVDGVCAISLRGISKEYPWPGSRCGWIEVFNRQRDELFDEYVSSLVAAKRLEVCSTTIPQMSIPEVMGDSRYPQHLEHRATTFSSRADEAVAAVAGVPGVIVNKPGGAFYLTVMFEDGVLDDQQSLPIENPEIRKMVEALAVDSPNDRRFVYYLMGATGICVVPLTGFCSDRDGFRITLLETDDQKRRWTFQTIADSIRQYLGR
jgi:aspartate/methionine/tyrosine aminotransferase